MNKEIDQILFSEKVIAEKIEELGKQITSDYHENDEVIVIGVLKGANIFLGDLVRKINLPLRIDFMAVSSYGNSTSSSGIVRILKDLDLEIENKHVVIVEDIVDTGLTLKYLTENLRSRKVSSLKICTLLDKPFRRKCDLHIDYVGFEIPDAFIVGYGIDYAEKYRNLPYIATIKE